MAKFDKDTSLLECIKKMTPAQLQGLSTELRKELIADVSETGGHLASNLGVVELTVALHKVFDSPKDKLIWDVGHQTYVHKMITGRRKEMHTLRQLDGISGFPKRSESEHDASEPGHSGTSISVALGYAKARDLKKEDYSCVAIIGDGALTGGVAWEALNSAGASKTPIIVILNDNEMSISRNVGGIAKHLHQLRTSSAYNNFKRGIKNVSAGTPHVQQFLSGVRNLVKYSVIKGEIFEELGFKYYGPIDGHNTEELVEALSFIKTLDRPVLLHVLTKKGKGYEPAEQNPAKYHGIGKFNPDGKVVAKDTGYVSMAWSDVFGRSLLSQAKKDERIVAITAAMSDSTGLGIMQEELPERVFDVGIAEQNAVAFAEGLALNGLRPVVAIYSTFLQRAYDQILTEVCLQKLPVIFGIDRAGVTGPDGETHQGVFDISFLSAIPGMHIFSPVTESEMNIAFTKALSLSCPCAIRYPKGNALTSFSAPDYIPEAEVCFVSDGCLAEESAKTVEILRGKGIAANMVRLFELAPLDKEMMKDLLARYSYVITVEDGCLCGGIGSQISSFAQSIKSKTHILNIAWPDKFIEHGTIAQLRARYGMDAEGIAKKSEDYFEAQA